MLHIPGEGYRHAHEIRTSQEAAELVITTLAAQLDKLTSDPSIRPHQSKGRQRFNLEVYPATPDQRWVKIYEYEAEYEAWGAERHVKGGIKSLRLNCNPVTGRVTYAEVSGILPAVYSKGPGSFLFNNDAWTTRFELPSNTDSDGQPRVVLDTWVLPVTLLNRPYEEVGRDLERLKQYEELYTNMFPGRNFSGIAPAATNVEHYVFGGNEEFNPTAKRRLETILGFFEQPTHESMASWQQLKVA